MINSNIEELLHNYKEEGMIGTSHPKSMKKAQKQAVAIAYSLAKKKWQQRNSLKAERFNHIRPDRVGLK